MNGRTIERALLGVSLILIVWMGASLVRVENERYALLVGLCVDRDTGMGDTECLSRVEARTHWAWHLYYALTGK